MTINEKPFISEDGTTDFSVQEVWKGERVYLEGNFTSSDTRLEETVRRYKKSPITTVMPSFKEAKIGAYDDILEPVPKEAEIADITVFEIPRDITKTEIPLFSKSSNATIILKVLDKILPETSVFPMYSEIGSEVSLYPKVLVMGGNIYGKDGKDRQDDPNMDQSKKDQWWKLYGPLQGPQTVKTIKLSRQFGIEPIKQSMSGYPGDLDFYEEYSYRNLVLKNTIAPPWIWCGGIFNPKQMKDKKAEEWLAMINDEVPENTIAFCADEPGGKARYALSIYEASKIIECVKKYAPKLRPMVTALPDKFYCCLGEKAVKELGIIFAPVQNCDNRPIELYPNGKGSYFSCMAQGNCKSKTDIANVLSRKDEKENEYPVAVVEGDPIKDFQESIKLAYKNGAEFILYYMLNKRTYRCWDKSWDEDGIGIYSEGGNGDGTAMYYDQQTGDPWPSVRMMNWDIARQSVEKEILTNR
jgi:hypothetical protein